MSRRLNGWAGGVAIGLAGWLIFAWWQSPRSQARRLADGTVIYYRAGTSAEPLPGFPHPREIEVDGDLLVRASEVPEPLILRSRLLTLTLSSGTVARVTAFSRETGEQVEVLSGRVVAQKAYSSRDVAPETLNGGEMVMINQTIDLMEKEKDTPEVTRRWSDELVKAAGAPR